VCTWRTCARLPRTTSPAFLKAYAAQRAEVKPEAPTFTGTSEEELAREMTKQKADQEKSAEEMKKLMASLPPDQRTGIEEGLKGAAAAVAQMNTPEMRKVRLDGIRMQRESATTEYRESLKRWEQDYPENPAPIIRRRLQAFLDLSATVDFNAQLEKRNGAMVFVNPAYERKDANWKLCYRAGRETVEGARAAVQAWLTELR
jgi:hypothetical protein